MRELIVILAMLLGNRWTVAEFAREYDVPTSLAACIVQAESRWNTMEVGDAGERGLFQIMPETAQWAADKLGYASYDLHDPIINAEMGVYILKHYPEWYSTLYLCEE